MVADKFVEGNILFSDGHALKTSDGASLHPIVGNSKLYGYEEGTGSFARFRYIGGIYQLNRTHVVVSDYGNHCLRMVHRETNHTTIFMGRCGVRGYRDGVNPLFSHPWSINLLSNNPLMVIVSDRGNNALRAVNLFNTNVSTLPLGYQLDDPRVAMFDDSRSALFVSSGRQIAKVNLVDYSVENITGNGTTGRNDGWFDEATFGVPQGMVKLSEKVLVVTDYHYDILRVLDLQQQSVRSILSGKTNRDADSDIRTGRVTRPRSLLFVDGFLYIGGWKVIKRVKGKYTLRKLYSLQPGTYV